MRVLQAADLEIHPVDVREQADPDDQGDQPETR
jgi:hypothetical protein